MARFLVSLCGAAAMLGLAITEVVVWVRMVANVNRQRKLDEQISKWWCTPVALRTVWRSHQVFYPESRLPLAYLLSISGLVLCFLVVAILETLMH